MFKIIGLILATWMSGSVFASAKGDVLVILSSEDKITLKGGVIHPTGFFLPELMGPVKALRDAGYRPIFANPKGTKPVMDKVSDSSFWFGNVPGASEEARRKADGEYREIRELCEELGLCGKTGTLVGSLTLNKLSDVRQKGLSHFNGVFFPGGHAPMEDLWKDGDVRETLRYFHQSKKTTALICHAPVALLSALDDPEGYINAKLKDDRRAMVEKTKNWIYRDYAVSVFTTREEQQEEPGGQDNALGGFVKFYADEALEKAGAYVSRADKWQSKVIISRELITGQNPFSHNELAEKLVSALDAAALEK